MVLRGVKGRRIEANFRKLKNSIREAHMGRKVTAAFKRGESQTAIIRMLREKGIAVGRDGLNRFLAYTKPFDQLVNYDAIRRIKGGARSGLNLASYSGIFQPGDILFKVTLRLSDGTLRTFNRYVTNFQGQSLADVYAELEVTYGETNLDSDTKGEIVDVRVA